MKTPATKDSTAIQFLQFVWDHVQETTAHSWLKLNHAMHDTLRLAVKSGMSFGLTDWQEIATRFRSGYWVGADSEWFYTLAVIYRHTEAYQTYEHARERKPFIVRGAYINTNTGDGPAGIGLARLVVGAQFIWQNERVTVTSFNDAAATFTACSYTNDRKVLCRYKISHADLAAARKATKVAA